MQAEANGEFKVSEALRENVIESMYVIWVTSSVRPFSANGLPVTGSCQMNLSLMSVQTKSNKRVSTE